MNSLSPLRPRAFPKIFGALLAPLAAILFASAAGATIRFDAPLLSQLAGVASLSWPTQFAVGDLNGDGRLDLVTSGPGDVTLVLLGNGDGTLQPPIVAAAPGFDWYDIADFDGDGFKDIACGGQYHGAEIFFGDGSGTHFTPVMLSGDPAFFVVAGDYDGDGRPDLATCFYSASAAGLAAMKTFLSRPGRASQAVTQNSDSLAAWVVVARSADFNRDGRADLAIAQGEASSDLLVGISNGDGTFSFKAVRYPQLWDTGGLDVADLNGDGIPDLSVARAASLTVFQGLGDGTFGAPQPLSPPPAHAYSIAAHDMNGDGIPDLVVPDLRTGMLQVRHGLGNFAFGPPESTAVGRPLSPIVVADMNGDEHPDVVAKSIDGLRGVFVALGDVDGGFEPHTRRTFVPGKYVYAAVGDFNNDGRADVVAPYDDGYTTQSVSILLAQPGHALVAMPAQPVNGGINGVFAADLDEDGKLDVVVWAATPESTLFTWYRGNGDGTLCAPVELAAPGAYRLFRVADANGDGHLDLVAPETNGVGVYPGRGDGTFGPPIEFPVTALDAEVGELNGDSIPDLAILAGVVGAEIGTGNNAFSNVPVASTDFHASLAAGIARLRPGGNSALFVPSRDIPFGGILGRTLLVSTFNPDGSLANAAQLPWPAAATSDLDAMSFRDVNGDGNVDAAYKLEAGFGIALGDGAGGMSPESGYEGYEVPLYYEPMVMGSCCYPSYALYRFGDFNGDGRLDALLTSTWNGLDDGITILWGRDPVPPAVTLLGPVPSTMLPVGQPANITWYATDNVGVSSIDLFVSRHGRDGPYQSIAKSLLNTGAYTWTVTPPLSDSVAFKVVARDSADNVAWDRSGGLLSIGGDVGVAGGPSALPRRLAIRSVAPNPSRGALAISFDLPRSGPASIALHDLLGRRVAALLEGSHPAGHAEVRVALDRVPAGLYFLVLRSGRDRAVARVALMQ